MRQAAKHLDPISSRAFRWSVAAYGAGLAAVFLFWDSSAVNAWISLVLTAAWPASVLVFARLYIATARHSRLAVLVGAVMFSVALFFAAYMGASFFVEPRHHSALVCFIFALFFTPAVMLPSALLAICMPHLAEQSRVLFGVAAVALLVAAAPGAWKAYGEPPFRTLLWHNPLAAGKVFFFAVTSVPETPESFRKEAQGQDRVLRLIRRVSLEGLPPAAQIEYARENDSVGAVARAAVKTSMRRNPREMRGPLLAEIERQGGAASGPETWWLFNAVSILPGDPEIQALMLARLAQAYVRKEAGNLDEAGTLAEALGQAKANREAVAIKMEAILEAKPEIAWKIWLALGKMDSAAANMKLGSWLVANNHAERAYMEPAMAVVHRIAASSPPLREALLARFRAGADPNASTRDLDRRAHSEWYAMTSYETPAEVADDLVDYLTRAQEGGQEPRIMLLDTIARSGHPGARSIVDRAIPAVLAVDGDYPYYRIMLSLLAGGFDNDPRLIASALDRFGRDKLPQEVCSGDRHGVFRIMFHDRHLKAWLASEKSRPVALNALDILAQDGECLNWLSRNAAEAKVVWPALRDRAIKAISGADVSDVMRGRFWDYLLAISDRDAEARASIEAHGPFRWRTPRPKM